MQYLRIVYPRGEKNLLSVVTTWSHDLDRWELASDQTFSLENADQAWDYAYELASKHGLTVEDDRQEGRRHDFLEDKEVLDEPTIYRWKSERFKDYYRGAIMVAARSLDEARNKAIAKYKIENPTWDTSGVHEFREFMNDLSAEPSVVEVAFVIGSS